MTDKRLPADRQICDGVFRTFTEALEAVPKERKVSFDHPEMATHLEDMAEHVLVSDYAIAFWLHPLLRERSMIFELGGNVGVTYYALRQIISFPTDLKWLVCDLPEINRRGVQLANQRNCVSLSFSDRYEDAEGCDAFLAFGTLQYVDTDLASILAMLKRKPTHLLINRTPLVEGDSYVTLQNLGPVVCAYRVFNRQEFIASLSRLGYQTIDQWECPESYCRVRYHPETTVKSYTGLYLKLEP